MTMPKYFFVSGHYADPGEAERLIEIIKTVPFSDLRHVFLGEVEARNPEEAIDLVEKDTCREAVYYIAIFDKSVNAFKEGRLLAEYKAYGWLNKQDRPRCIFYSLADSGPKGTTGFFLFSAIKWKGLGISPQVNFQKRLGYFSEEGGLTKDEFWYGINFSYQF